MNARSLPLGRRISAGYWQAQCETCDWYDDNAGSRARDRGRRHAAQNPGHKVVVDVTHSIRYETGLTHDGRSVSPGHPQERKTT